MSSRNVAQLRGDLESALRAHPVLHGTRGECASLIAEHGTLHALDAGDVLYRAGEPAAELYFLVRGTLQIELPQPGEERGPVAAMLAAPTIVGECQLVQQQPWSGTGVALQPTGAFGVTLPLLQAIFAEHQAVAWAIFQDVTRRFLATIERQRTTRDASPERAVARHLLALVDALAPGVSQYTLAIRQNELGLATGMRRETVNRALQALLDCGAVTPVGRGRRCVNVNALRSRL